MNAYLEAARHFNNLAYKEECEEFMREKMNEQRQECINYISTLVRQDLADDFAMILSAAYEYGSPEAERVAKRFGFTQRDFLAIEQNYEDYNKITLWREDE